MREEIKKQIQEKTPLELRAKFVALNHHLEQKKKFDKLLEDEILAIHLKYDKLSEPIYKSTNEIVNGQLPSQE